MTAARKLRLDEHEVAEATVQEHVYELARAVCEAVEEATGQECHLSAVMLAARFDPQGGCHWIARVRGITVSDASTLRTLRRLVSQVQLELM